MCLSPFHSTIFHRVTSCSKQIKQEMSHSKQDAASLRALKTQREDLHARKTYLSEEKWCSMRDDELKRRELYRLVKALPAAAKRAEIEATVRNSRFTVIKGETGSGMYYSTACSTTTWLS